MNEARSLVTYIREYWKPDFIWILSLYDIMLGHGFKLVTKPLKKYKDHTQKEPHRKANFDVEIAVDSTFSLNSFDTFILFSGDCDFEYLIKFLRGQGKIVIGFSRSGNIAKEIPLALTSYFDIAISGMNSFELIVGKRKIPNLSARDLAINVI